MGRPHPVSWTPLILAGLLSLGVCSSPGFAGELGADASGAFQNGLASLAQKNLDPAITWFGHAIRMDPKMAVAWLGRSMAGMEKHWQELSTQRDPNPEMKRAIEDGAIEAQRLDPRVFDAFRQMAGPQWDQAIATFAGRVKTLAAVRFTEAQALMTSDKVADALAACDRAVGLQPGNPTMRYMRGFFCRTFGQPDKAMADFNEIERLYRAAPQDQTALAFYRLSLIQRSRVYVSQGNIAQGLADASEAARLAPTNPDAWIARGMALCAKGKLDNALADFDKAIALDPRHSDAFYQRGLARNDKQDRNGALADLAEAIRLDPRNAHAHYARGCVLLEAGQLDASIASLNDSLRITQHYPACWQQLGRAFLLKGNLEQAIADLTEAIRQAPDLGQAYRLRAEAYAKKGDPARAAADSQRAAQLQRSRR